MNLNRLFFSFVTRGHFFFIYITNYLYSLFNYFIHIYGEMYLIYLIISRTITLEFAFVDRLLRNRVGTNPKTAISQSVYYVTNNSHITEFILYTMVILVKVQRF